MASVTNKVVAGKAATLTMLVCLLASQSLTSQADELVIQIQNEVETNLAESIARTMGGSADLAGPPG